MIRLIVRLTDTAAAANVGGPVETTYRTLDVELPNLEELLRTELREKDTRGYSYIHAELVAAELLP